MRRCSLLRGIGLAFAIALLGVSGVLAAGIESEGESSIPVSLVTFDAGPAFCQMALVDSILNLDDPSTDPISPEPSIRICNENSSVWCQGHGEGAICGRNEDGSHKYCVMNGLGACICR